MFGNDNGGELDRNNLPIKNKSIADIFQVQRTPSRVPYDVLDTQYRDTNFDASEERFQFGIDQNQEAVRAGYQSSAELWGKAITQGVSEAALGTLEGIGYLADFEQHKNIIQGTETEYGNWFSDVMKKSKEYVNEEIAPVYRTEAAQQGFAPSDGSWWASNAPSIASAVSLMIPAMGATKAASYLGKGARALGTSAGIASKVDKASDVVNATNKLLYGRTAGQVTEGITQAVFSRYMENTMEASGTYDEYYQKAIAAGKDPQLAAKEAGEAASTAWKNNWGNIVFDIGQYMSLTKGLNATNRASKAFRKNLLQKTAGFAGNTVGEGIEEGFQFVVSKEAQRKAEMGNDYEGWKDITKRISDYSSDAEFKTSVLLGMVGGGVFTGAGAGINKIQEKLAKNAQLDVAKQKAIDEGDLVTAHKINDAQFSSHAYQQASEGKLQDTIDTYKKMGESTDEELSSKWQMTPEQIKDFRERNGDIQKDLAFYQEQYLEISDDTRKDPTLLKKELDLKFTKRAKDKLRQKLAKEESDARVEAGTQLTPQEFNKRKLEAQKATLEANKMAHDTPEFKKMSYGQKFLDHIDKEITRVTKELEELKDVKGQKDNPTSVDSKVTKVAAQEARNELEMELANIELVSLQTPEGQSAVKKDDEELFKSRALGAINNDTSVDLINRIVASPTVSKEATAKLSKLAKEAEKNAPIPTENSIDADATSRYFSTPLLHKELKEVAEKTGIDISKVKDINSFLAQYRSNSKFRDAFNAYYSEMAVNAVKAQTDAMITPTEATNEKAAHEEYMDLMPQDETQSSTADRAIVQNHQYLMFARNGNTITIFGKEGRPVKMSISSAIAEGYTNVEEGKESDVYILRDEDGDPIRSNTNVRTIIDGDREVDVPFLQDWEFDVLNDPNSNLYGQRIFFEIPLDDKYSPTEGEPADYITIIPFIEYDGKKLRLGKIRATSKTSKGSPNFDIIKELRNQIYTEWSASRQKEGSYVVEKDFGITLGGRTNGHFNISNQKRNNLSNYDGPLYLGVINTLKGTPEILDNLGAEQFGIDRSDVHQGGMEGFMGMGGKTVLHVQTASGKYVPIGLYTTKLREIGLATKEVNAIVDEMFSNRTLKENMINSEASVAYIANVNERLQEYLSVQLTYMTDGTFQTISLSGDESSITTYRSADEMKDIFSNLIMRIRHDRLNSSEKYKEGKTYNEYITENRWITTNLAVGQSTVLAAQAKLNLDEFNVGKKGKRVVESKVKEKATVVKKEKPIVVKTEPVEPVVSNIKAKRADIERRRQEFPETQSNTRTPITQKLLDYFAEVNKLPKFTEDLIKGTYVSWLQNNGELGYKVAELLNAPKQAFDLIAKYDVELAALEETKETSNTINIYAGTNENAELSNFAIRPFVISESLVKFLEERGRGDYFDTNYKSVEQAFQNIKVSYNKSGFNDSLNDEILATTDGGKLRQLGKKVTLDVSEWDKDSSFIMKELLKTSFEQNPKSLETLLATGNATLTHTQDKGKWGKEFPKLLMEVREELKETITEDVIIEVKALPIEVIFEDDVSIPKDIVTNIGEEVNEEGAVDGFFFEDDDFDTGRDTEEGGDVKMSRKAVKGDYKVWNREEELAWFKENYPNVPISVLDDLKKISDNGGVELWGLFKNGSVYIASHAKEGTVYHEAFHAVFHILLNENERGILLKEFKGKNPIDKEENMADHFMEYKLTQGKMKTGLSAKVVDFFKRLYHLIQIAAERIGIKGDATIDDYMYRIDKGLYNPFKQKITFTKDITRFSRTYSSEGLTPRGEAMAIDTINSVVIGKGIEIFRSHLQLSKNLSKGEVVREMLRVSKKGVLSVAGRKVLEDLYRREKKLPKETVVELATLREYDKQVRSRFTIQGLYATAYQIIQADFKKNGAKYSEDGAKYITDVVSKFATLTKSGYVFSSILPRAAQDLSVRFGLGISIDRIVSDEDTEHDELASDEGVLEGWQVDVFRDHYSKFSERAKMAFATVQKDRDVAGYPIYESPMKVYAKLSNSLVDARNESEMNDKLSKVAEMFPSYQQVIQILEDDSKISVEMWRNMGNKRKVAFIGVTGEKTYDAEGNQGIKTLSFIANRENLSKDIVESWKDSFYNSPMFDGSTETSNVPQEHLDTLKALIAETNKLDKNAPLKKEHVETLFDILKKINMPVLKDTLYKVFPETIEGKKSFKTFIGKSGFENVLTTMVDGKNPFYGKDSKFYALRDMSKIIANGKEDTYKPIFRSGDKQIMTNVDNRFMLDHMLNLTGPDRVAFIDAYMRTAFYKNSPIMEELKDLKVAEKTAIAYFTSYDMEGQDNPIEYADMSPQQLEALQINYWINPKEYREDSWAYYMMPILSDSSNAAFMYWKKESSTIILEKLIQTAQQERDRIEWLQKRVDKGDTKDIPYNLLKNGLKYQIFAGLNEKNLDGDNFRKEVENLLRGQLKLEKQKLFTDDILTEVKDENGIISYEDNTGMLGKNVLDGLKDGRLNDYLMNRMYMNIQTMYLFGGDVAQYKSKDGNVDFVDVYKRIKQIHSPQNHLSVNPKNAFLLKDGKSIIVRPNYHVAYITDPTEVEKIRTVHTDIINKLFPGEENKWIRIEYGVEDDIKDPNKGGLNNTDAATYIDLFRMREIYLGTAKWNEELQEQYDEMILGKPPKNPKGEMMNVQKPFNYTQRFITGENGDVHVVPTQLKNSEALLTPRMAKGNPKLQKVLEKMGYEFKKDGSVVFDESKRLVDAVIFGSAVKVGQFNRLDSIDDINEKTIHRMENSKYAIQQETPEHYRDSEINVGTQLRKLMTQDLDHSLYYMVNGVPTLGSAIFKQYQEAINLNIKESFEQLKKIFYKPDGTPDLNGIVTALRKEVVERQMGEDMLNALDWVDKNRTETKLPLWDAHIVYQVEAILSSYFKNNVTKQKAYGVSLFNASSYGYEKINAAGLRKPELVIAEDENGNSYIKEVEVLMPAHARAMYDHYVGEDGYLDVSKVPDELKMGVFYRIPTEGKYSMFHIKVIGYLEGVGGQIIMPDEVTTIAGLDFDIDKLFGMMYNFENTKDGLVKIESGMTTKESRDNLILDIKYAILSHLDTMKKQLTPGNYKLLEEAKKEVLKLEGNVAETLNMMLPSTQREIFNRNMTGAALIGQGANQNVHHALVTEGDFKLPKGIAFNGKVLKDLSDKFDIFKRFKSSSLAQFIAAYVDNAKDPMASFLNITTTTSDLIATMIRVGHDPNAVMLMVASPAAKRFSKELAKEGKSVVAIDNVLDSLMEEVRQSIIKAEGTEALTSFEKSGTEVRVTKNTIVDTFKNPDSIDTLKTNFSIYQLMQRTFKQTQALTKTMNGMRFDAVGKAAGPMYANIIVSKRAWRDAKVTDGEHITGFNKFIESGVVPFVESFYKYGIEMPNDRILTDTNGKVIPLTTNFSRDSVQKDSDYIYLFTDNAKRTSGKTNVDINSWYAKKYQTDKYLITYPTMTQAVIRGLDNAFPITTMVDDNRTQWSDSQFDEYKQLIDDEINTIKEAQAKFKGIKFASQMPFGQGKISNMKQSAPKIWNYLNEKLAEIGIDNTGTTPKVVEQPIVEETPVDIYSQLGDKTATDNVVIKSVYQQKGVEYAKSIGGVFSLRINNSEKHFGNPFSSVQSEIAKGLIPTDSTKESVEKYTDWVINSGDSRAEWIREQLKSGKLKGKPIVYYKELGEPSHATALDYLINKYNWNSTQETPVTQESQGEFVERTTQGKNIILDIADLPYDKPIFDKIVERFALYKRNGELDAEEINSIYRYIMTAFVTGYKTFQHTDFNMIIGEESYIKVKGKPFSEVERVITTTPKRLSKYRNANPDSPYNVVLEQFQTRTDENSNKKKDRIPFKYIAFNRNGLDEIHMEAIKNAWKRMIYSEVKEERILGVDLAKYAFFSSGHTFNYNSFTDLVPMDFMFTLHNSNLDYSYREYQKGSERMQPMFDRITDPHEMEGLFEQIVRNGYRKLKSIPFINTRENKEVSNREIDGVPHLAVPTKFVSMASNDPITGKLGDPVKYIKAAMSEDKKTKTVLLKFVRNDGNNIALYRELPPLGINNQFIEFDLNRLTHQIQSIYKYIKVLTPEKIVKPAAPIINKNETITPEDRKKTLRVVADMLGRLSDPNTSSFDAGMYGSIIKSALKVQELTIDAIAGIQKEAEGFTDNEEFKDLIEVKPNEAEEIVKRCKGV